MLQENASGKEGGDIYNLCPRARLEFGMSSVWEIEIYLNVSDHD